MISEVDIQIRGMVIMSVWLLHALALTYDVCVTD